MRENERETFKELINLFPQIIQTSNLCIQRELHNFTHNKKRIDMERKDLKQIISIIQGKWTLEILYIIRIYRTINFNEIKKHLTKISSTILAKRLKS